MTEEKKRELEETATKYLNQTMTIEEIVDGKKVEVEYSFIDTAFTSSKEGGGRTIYKCFAQLKKKDGTKLSYSLEKTVKYFQSTEDKNNAQN